jgi:hypothetical protein
MVFVSYLLDCLKNDFQEYVANSIVDDLRIGVIYTGVKLCSGYGGMAATYHDASRLHCNNLPSAGNLAGIKTIELLQMADSPYMLQRCVGIAAVNAITRQICATESNISHRSNLDVIDLIDKEDRVIMIGHFASLVPRILKKVSNLYVAEKRGISDSRLIPVAEDSLSEAIASSDVVIVTASSLVNGTIDDFIDAIPQASKAVLLGPSSPLYPDPFFEKGFTAVMGTEITDADLMLDIVGQAGGTPQVLKRCGRKVSFVEPSSKV